MTSTLVGPALSCGCGNAWRNGTDWCCPGCGGPWQLPAPPPYDPALVEPSTWSLWRYAALLRTWLPGAAGPDRVSLGEGGTPLTRLALPGGSVRAKLEFLSPTGSYKDRGMALVVNQLRAAGATIVRNDSSGNAGASLAAYAAAAGLAARVYVPADASAGKKGQIAAFGAELVEVPGPRAAAGQACRQDRRGAYASHAWHPYTIAGMATCAWELWEQTGGRLPDVVVCPAGQGTLLRGLSLGFASLTAAGLLAAGPRLVAVQARACAPLATPDATVAEGPTRAEGIRIVAPVRKAEVLAAVRDSGGAVVTVSEPQIESAEHDLARAGVLVEPTSAVVAAALPQVRATWGTDQDILLVLTGSGLKTTLPRR